MGRLLFCPRGITLFHLETKQGCCSPAFLGRPWVPPAWAAETWTRVAGSARGLGGVGGQGGSREIDISGSCSTFFPQKLQHKPPLCSPSAPSSTQSTASPTLSAAPASDSQRGATQTHLGPRGAPSSRCDHRAQNVTVTRVIRYFPASDAGLYLNHFRQMVNCPILKDRSHFCPFICSRIPPDCQQRKACAPRNFLHSSLE